MYEAVWVCVHQSDCRTHVLSRHPLFKVLVFRLPTAVYGLGFIDDQLLNKLRAENPPIAEVMDSCSWVA